MHVLGRVEKFRDRLQLDVRALEPAEADPAALAPRCGVTPRSWRASSSSSSRRSRIPGSRATVARPRDASLRQASRTSGSRLTTRTRADCSSTPSASRRSAARPPAPSAPARRPPPRRGARARRRPHARAAAAPAFRPTEEGRLLGHVHLGLRLIEERAAGLTGRAAELLHCGRSTTTPVPRERPKRRCSTTRTSSTRSPRRGPVPQ